MILGIGRRILVKVLCNLFPNYDFISPYPLQLLSIKLSSLYSDKIIKRIFLTNIIHFTFPKQRSEINIITQPIC